MKHLLVPVISFVAATLLFNGSVAALQSAETRPNILVILADDLGYADLSCQGALDVITPPIDTLAASGVRCTAGYVTAPQSSPSRAGLLSGQYQQRFGHQGNPNFPLMLMRGGKIIPDYLKAAGYATADFGKWHLSFSDLGSAPKEFRQGSDQISPTPHGFDESFGYPEDDQAAMKGSDIPPARHAHDDRVFARKAVDFFERSRGQPWFIYLALHAPHMQQVDFGGYRDRFRQASPERVDVLGVMAQQDEAVGTVQTILRPLEQFEDALVIFVSDNGGTQRGEGESKHVTGSLNTSFSGDKGTRLEGRIRVPFIVTWPAQLPAGRTYDHPVSTLDVLPIALAAARIKPLDGVHLDGVNLLPSHNGQQPSDPHAALFWRWRAEQAIRIGDWQLVCGREQEVWRLIDLANDVKEANALTATYPGKTEDLLIRFEAWNNTLHPWV